MNSKPTHLPTKAELRNGAKTETSCNSLEAIGMQITGPTGTINKNMIRRVASYLQVNLQLVKGSPPKLVCRTWPGGCHMMSNLPDQVNAWSWKED